MIVYVYVHGPSHRPIRAHARAWTDVDKQTITVRDTPAVPSRAPTMSRTGKPYNGARLTLPGRLWPS